MDTRARSLPEEKQAAASAKSQPVNYGPAAVSRQRVLAYVVVEDGHQAYVAVVGTGGRQRRSSSCALRSSTDWNSGNASAVLASD